jgi:hypothetical protein
MSHSAAPFCPSNSVQDWFIVASTSTLHLFLRGGSLTKLTASRDAADLDEKNGGAKKGQAKKGSERFIKSF